MRLDREESRAVGGALMLALLLSAVPVPASAESKPILLQSYVGAQPNDADYFVGYLIKVMGKEGPRHGQALAKGIESRISRSAGPLQIGSAVQAKVERGRRQFIEGNYAQAITLLEEARGTLLSRVAAVASNQAYRNSLHKCLLYLAHAYLRAQKPERATDRVSEAIRTFADRDLSLAQHAPELVRFYKRVRRELDRQGRSSLSVKTSPSGCMVFINERFIGISPAHVNNLFPGRYRVYVQKSSGQGRSHEVNIGKNDAELTVDFALDRALQTGPYVGLRYDDARTQRQLQVSHAATIGRAVDAPMVLLVSFNTHEGRRTMVGTVVSTSTERTVRSGIVALEPTAPSPEAFSALARFLLVGQSGPGVIVSDATLPPVKPPSSTRRSQRSSDGFFSAGFMKWLTLGLAASATAGGLILIALDGTGTCTLVSQQTQCPSIHQTLAAGIGLSAAAVALATTSIYLFIRDSGKRQTVSAAVLTPYFDGRGGGIAATLHFR